MQSPVTYDRRSFLLNGKPFLILSGSAHYIRLHPSRWDQLFQTFLDAKLNTLETYIFWGAHERPEYHTPVSPPPSSLPPVSYDFTGRLDLFAFIAAAGRKGLKVILRIGPYVCAEVSYGGFPLRLRNVPGIQFRTYNEPFMREMERWVRFIAGQLHERKLLATCNGPIILVQLENEYSMVSDSYGDSGQKYLQWCADLQKDLDFQIPAIMCYGAADGVVETINAFYAHRHVDEHRRRHPDQPPVWTECWTGWYNVWGAAQHHRCPKDLAYAVARFFAVGGAGVNYYMWMGGTNFERDAMYLQTTSYDYDAPVDEMYGPTSKYMHLAKLHQVLVEVFESEFFKCRDDAQEVDGVLRWGDVAFICNDGTDVKHVSLSDRGFENEIEGHSVQIVDASGCLLYNSAELCDVIEKTHVQVDVTCLESWKCYPRITPRVREEGDVIGQGGIPPEQLSVTKDGTDYCWYMAEFERKGQGSGEMIAEFEAADLATVYIDGVLAGQSGTPLWEDRWPNKWNDYADVECPGSLQRIVLDYDGKGEKVQVTILICAMGLVKGDWQLGCDSNMLKERKGVLSEVAIKWKDGGCYERCGEWAARSAGMEMGQVAAGNCVEGHAAWYTCSVSVEEGDGEGYVTDMSGAGKGVLWINGWMIGRFWDIEGSRGRNGFLDHSPIGQKEGASQHWYHVPEWAVAGKQVNVVMYVEDGRRPAGRAIKLWRIERRRNGRSAGGG